MGRDLRPEPTIPDAEGLAEGLRGAFGLFVSESNLDSAVGETGVLRGYVEVFIERGRAKHSKGSCYFERRVELRNG